MAVKRRNPFKGKRSKRVRFGRNAKGKPVQSMKKIVRNMIRNNSEFNTHYFFSGDVYKKYVASSSTSLRGDFFKPMQQWPTQSLTSTGRQGKIIRNVIANYAITLYMYGYVRPTVNRVPTRDDIVPWIMFRVIVFTSDTAFTNGTDIPDFWNKLDNTVDLNMNRINRTKITVLLDKIVSNSNMNSAYIVNGTGSMPAQTVTGYGIQKTKTFKVKRKWKQISFPTDTSIIPADHKKITYLAVIPITQHQDTTNWYCDSSVLQTMYFNA